MIMGSNILYNIRSLMMKHLLLLLLLIFLSTGNQVSSSSSSSIIPIIPSSFHSSRDQQDQYHPRRFLQPTKSKSSESKSSNSVLLLAGQSFLGDITNECKMESIGLLTSRINIIEATSNIQQWSETLENICSQQTSTKTTCIRDYTTFDHTLQQACNEIPGAIYLTANIVHRCHYSEGNIDLFYTNTEYPQCYSKTCGINGAYGLIEEYSNEFTGLLMEATDNIMDCNRVRLEFSEPIINEVAEQVELSCEEHSKQIMHDINPAYIQLSTDIRSFFGDNPNNMFGYQDHCLIQQQQDVCNVDFVRDFMDTGIMKDHCSGHNFGDDVPDGEYLEASYTISCTSTSTNSVVSGDDEESTMMIYITNHPICASTSFCGYDDFYNVAMMESQTIVDYIIMSSSDSDNDSTSTSTTFYCEILVDSLIVIDFHDSTSPTVSTSPTISPQPTPAPTTSPAPTLSQVPTSSPTDISCVASTISLNNTDSIRNTNYVIQNTILDLQPISSSYCRYPDPTAIPYIIKCEIDYSNIDHNLQDNCESTDDVDNNNNNNAIYVEDTITMICQEEDITTTNNNNNQGEEIIQITTINKPGCRSSKCNGLELKDIDKLDFDLSIKPIFVLEGLITQNMTCQYDTIHINMGGIDRQGSLLTTSESDDEECDIATSSLLQTTDIYNQQQLVQQEFQSYINVEDLRQIGCIRSDGIFECLFDFASSASSEVDDANNNNNFGSLSNDYEMICTGKTSSEDYDYVGEGEEGGPTNNYYIEYSFLTECQQFNDEWQILKIRSENVPSCVPKASDKSNKCSLSQTKDALQQHSTWIAAYMQNNYGWMCSTVEVTDIYPSIDLLTTIIENDDGSNNGGPIPSDDNNNNNNEPTQAPGGGAGSSTTGGGGGGQQFGFIFSPTISPAPTQSPKPTSEQQQPQDGNNDNSDDDNEEEGGSGGMRGFFKGKNNKKSSNCHNNETTSDGRDDDEDCVDDDSSSSNWLLFVILSSVIACCCGSCCIVAALHFNRKRIQQEEDQQEKIEHESNEEEIDKTYYESNDGTQDDDYDDDDDNWTDDDEDEDGRQEEGEENDNDYDDDISDGSSDVDISSSEEGEDSEEEEDEGDDESNNEDDNFYDEQQNPPNIDDNYYDNYYHEGEQQHYDDRGNYHDQAYYGGNNQQQRQQYYDYGNQEEEYYDDEYYHHHHQQQQQYNDDPNEYYHNNQQHDDDDYYHQQGNYNNENYRHYEQRNNNNNNRFHQGNNNNHAKIATMNNGNRRGRTSRLW